MHTSRGLVPIAVGLDTNRITALPPVSPDYAVQPQPVEFSAVPQSQRVVEGDSVLLTCNFSVIQLGSNYPKPHTIWRQNGTLTLKTSDIDGSYTYSELLLSPVMPHHTGYYECLAVDGKKKFDHTGEGKHITSSPQAYLHVVCKWSTEIIREKQFFLYLPYIYVNVYNCIRVLFFFVASSL